MITPDANSDTLPPLQQIKKTIHRVRLQSININNSATLTRTISMDQTGSFPITSQQANKYVMVLYNYNTKVFWQPSSKTGQQTN